MGGLLAADAATDPSNTRSHRIVGMIAFDTPFLGMHPHVVISGIASLFPKKESDGKTVGDMNANGLVEIVDDAVTDDWTNFKNDLKSKRIMQQYDVRFNQLVQQSTNTSRAFHLPVLTQVYLQSHHHRH